MVRPSNATLVIVGDLDDTGAWTQSVVRYLAGWKDPEGAAPTPPPQLPSVPASRAEMRTLVFDDDQRTQATIHSTCRLAYAGTQDQAAIAVLHEALQDRVFSDLREAEGLAYGPDARPWVEFDGTAFATVFAEPSNPGAGRALELLQGAWSTFDEIDATRVQHYKLRASRAAGLSLQSIDQISRAAIDHVVTGRDLAALEKFGDAIAAVTADDLRRLTQACGTSTVTVVLGPIKDLAPQFASRKLPFEVIDWGAHASAMLKEADPAAYRARQAILDKFNRK